MEKAVKTFGASKRTVIRLTEEKYGTLADAANTKIGRPIILLPVLEEELSLQWSRYFWSNLIRFMTCGFSFGQEIQP